VSADAWFTLAIVVATIAVMASERFRPALVMLASVVVLLVTGVVDQDAAFAGFSNEAPFIVAALYVVAGAAEATGALDRITERILGRRRADPGVHAERRDLARIAFPTMAASGLVANTPLVALMAPRVAAWARRTGRSSSRFLMPLSHAAVFGGVITVLGTSANVTVSGLLRESGRDQLDVFEITPVGLPIAVAGVVVLVLLSPQLLPKRLSPSEADTEATREFTLEMQVAPASPLAGRTVTEAGLRNLEGVFLLELERNGDVSAPVGPDDVLAPGDRLTFAGAVSRVLDLQRIPGLVSAEQRHFSVVRSGSRATYEVVIGEGSPLAGRTLKEIGFRGRYGGAVFAIHRAGERIPAKLGDVRLRAGDLLLVLADQEFRERWQDTHDFLVVSPLEGAVPVRREHAIVVELTLLALVITAGTGILSLLEASLLAAGGLVIGRMISLPEARRAIDFEVILMIAASFGLGAAMGESGLAEELGRLLVSGSDTFGDVGVLAAVLLATMLLTELLSNNAAAVLMFPIALAAAADAGVNFRPLAIAILVGASCSFLTPIGYQTNLLVYGMGGYRFLDFTRVGAPLTLLTIIVALIAIPIAFPLS
jgi:di/tricarboxylate transporter